MIDDDILVFDDDDSLPPHHKNAGWKVMIIDDEPEIHHITTITLGKFIFDNRPIEFLHAYSAAQAKELLTTNSDVALLLLDVVMESDNAGFEVVKFVRNTLENKMIRIVIRTGQPGQAPEDDVVNLYDINDYKDKTELTSQKLRTLLRSSLRSYRDIYTLSDHLSGLEKIVDASRWIFDTRSLRHFIERVETQLKNILHLDVLQHVIAFSVVLEQIEPIFAEKHAIDIENYRTLLHDAITNKRNIYKETSAVLNCQNSRHHILFYIETAIPLNHMQVGLLDLFTENIVIALENLRLNDLIADNQREIIYRIGELVETRSKESGLHVKRVALYTEQFCLLIGMDEERCELIKRASPLHDIGKVGIPDNILHKAGKLTPDEWEIMKNHAQLGQDMLSGSDLALFQVGANIAGNHHEKWDGTGYPRTLKGTEIPIEGRIVALADVFDALASDRCYKKAWPIDEVLLFIQQEKGKHFDPDLVDIMMNNLPCFFAIREKYKDTYISDH